MTMAVPILIIISIGCGLLWLKGIGEERTDLSKNAKYFGWACLIFAGIALYTYSEQDRTRHLTHGEKIPFVGKANESFITPGTPQPPYTYLYRVPAYDGSGNLMGFDVIVKSDANGNLFAFPNGTTTPTTFQQHYCYDSPGTYFCSYGGGFIYF